MAVNVSEFSKDTRRLDPWELSRDEVLAIQAIEDRLRQAQLTPLDGARDERDRYLAFTEDRHPRVLLLDGARGTGKTSFMLTLVKRWHPPSSGKEVKGRYHARQREFEEQAEKLGLKGALDNVPSHVRVLDILDFDPLPPGMPLIAALVQAWRPLILEYDRQTTGLRNPEQEADDTLLIDHWHRLFAMAAAGWSSVSSTKGLVEQVLDREEQVQDWQDLDHHWRSLINDVINCGRSLREPHALEPDPVFVIMIDDCDLQVERVRELLPALRLLYHPRLFFLVAADRPHMIDMLNLDFLGQQSRLAGSRSRDVIPGAVSPQEWATSLAEASFEKVFPIRNRWRLPKLSLAELLEFKIENQSFREILDGWKQDRPHPSVFPTLGVYLTAMAGEQAAPIEIPRAWTYRTAHQIAEDVVGRQRPIEIAVDSEVCADEGGAIVAASEAIGRLLARSEYDTLVRIIPAAPIEGQEELSALDPQAFKPQSCANHRRIEYLQQGVMEGYFVPEVTEDISHSAQIIISAQPYIRYYHGQAGSVGGAQRNEDPAESERKTSAILAVSLQDDGFGISTPRLQWDARLTLVWTRMNLANHNLALAWPWYRHPSPLRLLNWARGWSSFVTGLRQKTAKRPDRIAYAWIYYQLTWMGSEGLERALADIRDPLSTDLGTPDWKALIECADVRTEEDEEGQWRSRTLPLLARPEIGLTPDIQQYLLQGLDNDQKKRLQEERRRLITDAIYNSAEEARKAPPEDANRAQAVEEIIKNAEARFQAIHDTKEIPWNKATGDKARSLKGSEMADL
jgi:hypothetical protein